MIWAWLITGATMGAISTMSGVSWNPEPTQFPSHVQDLLNTTWWITKELVEWHWFWMIPQNLLPGFTHLPEIPPQVYTLLQCLQRSRWRIWDNAIGAINYGSSIGIVNWFDSFFYDPSTNSFMTWDLWSWDFNTDYHNFKGAIDTVIQLCRQWNGYS